MIADIVWLSLIALALVLIGMMVRKTEAEGRELEKRLLLIKQQVEEQIELELVQQAYLTPAKLKETSTRWQNLWN